MTKQAPLSVNNLPTKFYLEQTITPTVLKALSEVARARPDKPLEFVAYYLLKHNPNRQSRNEGTPIGHRHPDDKANEDES
jgi:protein dpy-30